jgi:hypothetical protein
MSLKKSTDSNMNKSIISFVTDVEGNFTYWKNYISFSKILKGRAGDGKLELIDSLSQLVYGGDVCDRGTGDVRVLKDLIGLKKDYPDRIHFILGNRDVNKLRLPFELTKSAIKVPPTVYWIRNKDEITQENIICEDTLADRLKWVNNKYIETYIYCNYILLLFNYYYYY